MSLPELLPAGAAAGRRRARERRAVPPEVARALAVQAERAGVPLATLLLAAFNSLCFRLAGSDRPALAVRVRGGPTARPPRVALADDDSLASLAGRLAAALDAPAGAAVDDTPDPLLFSAIDDPAAALDADGYAIALIVATRHDRIDIAVDHDAARLAPEAAARLADRFATLLAAAAATPECGIGRLDILPAAERRLLLDDWNRTARPFPAATTLQALFRLQAARTPTALAVGDRTTRLTYAELDRRSDVLAARLVERGAAPGTRIGICVDRSATLVVALLGILKSGAAYVPLDPGYPADRIGFMVANSGAILVLTERSVAASLPGSSTPVVLIDELGLVSAAAPEADLPATRGTADDLAYVIYTSGSTGRPKGVRLAHRGVVNLLYAMRDELGFTGADRVLAVTSISFDISVLELFLPLVFGAALIVAARSETSDGAALVRRLAASRASLMQATPVTWRLMLQAGWQGSPGLKLLCGGEAIDPGLARQLVGHGSGRFWNVYGPTETTIWSTAQRVTAVDGAIVPIGRPLANTRLYILDGERRPVPIGSAGELYIAGAGVACGYLNRPELTAERFLPDPFAEEEANESAPGLMYRTGDLARYRPDGAVEFLGRLDQQVKIRGFRVELGAVETVLAQADTVRQAVAVARPQREGGGELVVFVVPAGASPAAAVLRRHVAASLPDYMVPSRIFAVDTLPLTPNGKIDRNALLAAIPETLDARDGYRPPGDALEARLVEIFEDVLGVRPIGIDDDFFDLGGHSLRVVSMIDLVERRCGRRLSINTVYHQGASVAYLAGVLRDPESRARLPYLVPLTPDAATSADAPIFCMHTIVEERLLYYQALARRLGASCPLLGILPQGSDDGLPAHATIEEMGAHCVAVMRAHQPLGPYRLLGFSNAGVIAFEAAQQLRRAGLEVELLGLLDSYGPVGRRTLRFHREMMADRLRRLRDAVAARRARHRVERAADREATGYRGLPWRHRWALRRYQPDRYDGRVTLVAAADTVPLFHGRFLGWDRLAGDFDYHAVPGGHYDVVNEPGVARLEAILRRLLSRAGGSEAVGPPVAPARSTVAA